MPVLSETSWSRPQLADYFCRVCSAGGTLLARVAGRAIIGWSGLRVERSLGSSGHANDRQQDKVSGLAPCLIGRSILSLLL